MGESLPQLHLHRPDPLQNSCLSPLSITTVTRHFSPSHHLIMSSSKSNRGSSSGKHPSGSSSSKKSKGAHVSNGLIFVSLLTPSSPTLLIHFPPLSIILPQTYSKRKPPPLTTSPEIQPPPDRIPRESPLQHPNRPLPRRARRNLLTRRLPLPPGRPHCRLGPLRRQQPVPHRAARPDEVLPHLHGRRLRRAREGAVRPRGGPELEPCLAGAEEDER